MKILFMKIDANTDDLVDWDDFSTFMLLRAQGESDMAEEEEHVLFDVDAASHPRSHIMTPHKDVIKKMVYIPQANKYVTCSRDGTMCFWSESLKLQRCLKNLR
jgi:WD40 repeat protein